ncbi:MAG: hypothetical protein ACLFTJ_06200 [Halothece sp.]
MLNPTHGNWKTLATKPILFASGSILTALTVFSFAQGNDAQRIAIAAATPSAITSLLFLGHQKGKVDQLKRSQQQAEQELQQLKSVLKHKEETYQTKEASLIQENQQLLETKEGLERQLQETQGMESLLTEENAQLVKSKSALEQEFKEQEEGYLQEIEQLDLKLSQVSQTNIQLKEEIKQLKEQLQVTQESLNSSVSSSPSFEHIKIALVGSNSKDCQEIKQIMEQEYQVQRCQVIPNKDKQVLRSNTFKDKVKDADYIFVLSGLKPAHKKYLSSLDTSDVFNGKIINLAHSNREIIPSIVDTLQG